MRSSSKKISHIFAYVFSVTLVAALAILAMVVTPQQMNIAHAVIPIGPGYQIPNPYRDSIIGGYIGPDGSVLYCLEWGKESPTGPNDPVLSVEKTATYDNWSHLEVARVNYIISKWGQTADNDQAAAVAMAIWMRHPGTNDPFFPEHRFVRATITDTQKRAVITQRAHAMNAEANTFVPRVRAAIGEITITPDAEGSFTGQVSVSGVPAEANGTLQIAGATFEITDSSSVVGVSEGDSFRYRAEPTDDQFGSFVVSVQAVFVTPGTPDDELIVWRTPETFQNLGQASSWVPDFHFALEAQHNIDISFAPMLATQAAEQLVLAGNQLVDTVTFSLATGEQQWRRLSDETFLEVTAWCQAYGPLREHPHLSAMPPSDAPIFGERKEFSVGGALDDPLKETYEVVFETRPAEPGHYTFVCGIDQEGQTFEAAMRSLPAGYSFQHEYGLEQETVLVSSPLAKTGLSQQMLGVAVLAASLILGGVALWLGVRMRAKIRAS